MKKLSIFIISVLAIITTTTTSCMQMQPYRDSSVIWEYNLTDYSVQLIYVETPEYNRILSIEQTEYLNSVLSVAEWQPGVTKTYCRHRFEFNGVKISYSTEGGDFIDDINQRHMVVTEEQRDHINSYVIGIAVQKSSS